MTEHVHEWAIRGDDAVCLARLENGNRCYAVLLKAEVTTRLNATERLSAEDAVILANALDDIAVAWDGKDAGEGTKRLRAYADILDGEHEYPNSAG